MNISSEIFTTDGSNFSNYNSTEKETGIAASPVNIILILLGLPINFYVIWLIVTGAGNGLAAEFFGLNLAVCEVLYCMECFIKLLDYIDKTLRVASIILDGLALTSRPLFQCLISVERYLAVVHPVTFLKFKPLRYRVICSVIVWMASFVTSGISIITKFLVVPNFYYIFIMAYFFLFLSIQLFLLLAVLRALKQSGPGEKARERNNTENYMKRKAVYLILITTGTILIIVFPQMILNALSVLVYNERKLVMFSLFCFILAGLVHPLLFLCRVGKWPS